MEKLESWQTCGNKKERERLLEQTDGEDRLSGGDLLAATALATCQGTPVRYTRLTPERLAKMGRKQRARVCMDLGPGTQTPRPDDQ